MGQPMMYWLKVLHDRDEEQISTAFDAVRSLGADGWIAVPDLATIVGAPFTPIEIGTDSRESIAAKVYDIAVRTEAIDTLGSIGESAAPATSALIRWALLPRIVRGTDRSPDNNELFMELVAVDAEQRMRVAGAVAQFGQPAFPAVAALLSSPEREERKLAVAILNRDALFIATDLLRSSRCEERKLGLSVLKDMDLVVAKVYLDELANEYGEKCTTVTEIQ